MNKGYQKEVYSNWGQTAAYREYKNKTIEYTNDNWKIIHDAMNAIFICFSKLMNCNTPVSDIAVQDTVKSLQEFITANFYTCTDDILLGLGKMYVSDERFMKNIDKNGQGTAEYVKSAIEFYCLNK